MTLFPPPAPPPGPGIGHPSPESVALSESGVFLGQRGWGVVRQLCLGLRQGVRKTLDMWDLIQFPATFPPPRTLQ